MADAKFSEFTLNFNPAARANDKAPTLRGSAKVIDSDGAAVGTGRLFERADVQTAAGDRERPKFNGHALVLLPSGPAYIDLAAWYRPNHDFYSGSARLHDPKATAAARATPKPEPR